jgi:hypothetical protein
MAKIEIEEGAAGEPVTILCYEGYRYPELQLVVYFPPVDAQLERARKRHAEELQGWLEGIRFAKQAPGLLRRAQLAGARLGAR